MPRAARRVVALLVLLVGTAAASDDALVIRAGTAQVTVGEARARLALMSPAQRTSLPGGSDLRAQLDQVVVPELLWEAHARELRLEARSEVAHRVEHILRAALVDALARDLTRAQPVTEAEIARYYTMHQEHFVTPKRVRIWRILVPDEARARALLAAVRGVSGPQRWSELARGESLDKATAMRKGDLGFVQADGRTEVPQVRVAPELYAAADRVRDGELVPEPIREGDHFALVWRRGTRAGREIGLVEATPQIREVLAREQLRKAVERLTADLRTRHVRPGDAAAVEALASLPIPDALSLPPTVLSARAASRAPAPSVGVDGLR